MSEIKALEDLRKWAQRVIESCCTGMKADEVLESADEIQAEIDERFTLLPVDADGVPWTLETETFVDDTGREVEFSGLQVDREGRWKILNICVWHDPSLCRHVKPDPLKELLSELANEVWEASCTCQTTWSDSGLDGIEERYANRIRELMEDGGDD